MSFDPWNPIIGTVIEESPKVEMMATKGDKVQVGYLELVKDWPVGEVYWYVTSPNTRALVEYLCSADEFVLWYDVWEQFQLYQGDDNTEQDKFKFACVSLWDSKRDISVS